MTHSKVRVKLGLLGVFATALAVAAGTVTFQTPPSVPLRRLPRAR